MLIDENLQANARALVESTGDEAIASMSITTGTGSVIAIDPAIADLLGWVVRGVARGGAVTVLTAPELLTTTAAADLLGVSRPTLMKLIRDGEIEPVMAGSHHRLRHSEVRALRDRREAARREAIEELLDLE